MIRHYIWPLLMRIKWKGVNYFNDDGMSFREGRTPFNFHISWGPDIKGFYVYLFGLSLSKFYG